MPIDPNKVSLQPSPDGDVDVMYDDWYIVTITRRGGLVRHTSVHHNDLNVTDDGDSKIRLVKARARR